MEKIPVIFIHQSDPNYLVYPVTQANKYNEKIYLIGDDSNNHYPTVTHYMIKDYNERVNEFSKIYTHLSTNGHECELICFNRWFILENFMKKNNIDKCLYLDSDVLLYADATEEFKKFEQFDFTISHRCCGSNAFFTYQGLKKFCDFLFSIYENKNSYNFEKIASHYHIRNKHSLGGGVCDMTLLEFYHYIECGKIGEMMYIIEGSTYDHNINVEDQYFEIENGIKKISFVDKLPYCKQLSTGKQIRFNTLHFQGGAKNKMFQYIKL